MSLKKESGDNKIDFENELFKRMLLVAEKMKKDYLDQYGPVDEMSDFDKSIYKHSYENVTEQALKLANQHINCGGYAFEIDDCLFPTGTDFSAYISGLINEFSFIRLLGDEPLHNDEYLVFYRISDYDKESGKNQGHHFVKVNDDGLVVDKCGGESPRIFPGWPEQYVDSPEVVFAVKKNHDNLLDSKEWGYERDKRIRQGLDFNDTVSEAIAQKSNSFSYHGHSFKLKKSSDQQSSVSQELTDEDIFVVDDNGNIVADVLTDGETVAVGIKKEKIDFVENLSGPVKPVIENGRLVNFDEFKGVPNRDTDEPEH